MQYIQQLFELISLNWHTNAFPDALLILEELSRSIRYAKAK
jgi:hypothetical protein